MDDTAIAGALEDAMSEYEQYLEAQRAKTLAQDANVIARGPLRVHYLAWQLKRLVPDVSGEALCVGCRNVYELEAFQRLGLDVTGIDLVRLHPTIKVMDLHHMMFDDWTWFDVVVLSHVLEHAYDLDKALKECARVTKPGGLWVLEMPVNFTTNDVDRHDVKSLKAFSKQLYPYLQRPLWAQDTGSVIRLIARTHG